MAERIEYIKKIKHPKNGIPTPIIELAGTSSGFFLSILEVSL